MSERTDIAEPALDTNTEPVRVPAIVPPTSRAARRAEFADAANRWPLSRIIGVGVLVIALMSAGAVAAGAVALFDLYSARSRVIDKIDPAIQQSLTLDAALVNQETGVRGYALAAQSDFLQPYSDGLASESQAVSGLYSLFTPGSETLSDLQVVLRRAQSWRDTYATPTIAAVRNTGKPQTANVDTSKNQFDDVRQAVQVLQTHLEGLRVTSVQALTSASTTLVVICVIIAIALVLIVVVLAFGLRTAAIRPLSKLSAETRLVSDGDFEHQVGRSGPREVRELGLAVDVMRERILHELSAVRTAHAALDLRTQDLQRSNAELEQFAYVASHDLQEPLRKVASFCQLLQRRYAGRLDERADQYIEFAVDGAKRMQVLINDLLAFSRVGRVTHDRVATPCETLVAQAVANLSSAIEQSQATVEVGPLPTVMAEAPLLTGVFQNLLSNALKFRGEAPPVVRVNARRRDDDMWEFSVADNGIGIDADYAERIFVIFQRLHPKESYPGTGIGLAMCRKIVEYHGGTIWLDTTVQTGARFCFTIPVLPDDEDDHHDD